MPRHNPRRVSDAASANRPTAPDHRNDSDFAAMAELIAAGQLPFPTELAESEQQQLAEQVGRLRHARLVKFIARQIALDIARTDGPD